LKQLTETKNQDVVCSEEFSSLSEQETEALNNTVRGSIALGFCALLLMLITVHPAVRTILAHRPVASYSVPSLLGIVSLLLFFAASRFAQSARTLTALHTLLHQQMHSLESADKAQIAQQEQIHAITEEMMVSNEMYQHSSQRFQELFQGLPFFCFTYDAEGRIFECNRSCEIVFGWAQEELLQQTLLKTLCLPEHQEQTRQIVTNVMNGTAFQEQEWQCRRADGTTLPILISSFPLRDREGRIYAGISTGIDITLRKQQEQRIAEQFQQITQVCAELEMQKHELETANARLQALATTDGLTGLNNHRAFQDFLEAACQHCMREEAYTAQQEEPGASPALSVVLLDVDHFKKYNDTFGHPAGDVLLKGVASLLQERVEEGQMAARYGGEEFVLLLPDQGVEAAREFAEGIRATIEATDWPCGRITASFGVATWRPDTEGRKQLIAEADTALYVSKSEGRNRVTTYSAPLLLLKKSA
jgi:diguanylate cyclase (GGDEF)-like protein/PAS domain S-box-containing protein